MTVALVDSQSAVEAFEMVSVLPEGAVMPPQPTLGAAAELYFSAGVTM